MNVRRNSAGLTERQREVLSLISEGASNVQIAGELEITLETVKSHVKHILQAYDAHSRAQAVAIAIREGEIE